MVSSCFPSFEILILVFKNKTKVLNAFMSKNENNIMVNMMNTNILLIFS